MTGTPTPPDPVSLVAIGRYLPGEPVGVDHYLPHLIGDDALNWDHPMFVPPRHRHLVDRDETAVDMIEQAAEHLARQVGHDAVRKADVVITNVLLPDLPHAGAGACVAHRLGVRPARVYDVHNGGCASFVLMLELAVTILRTTDARTALVANVQNCAGPVFTQPENLKRATSAIPGDGAALALLDRSATAPVLAVSTRHVPEAGPDMALEFQDDRKYWEPGTGQLNVRFTDSSVARIIARGNGLVPAVVEDVCRQIGEKPTDVDVLVTNQPNRMFLRNWGEALGVRAGAHLDTFDRYGNLFGAGAPITLSHAIEDDRIPDGALIVLAGFAHAGDFAAAAALRWRGQP